MMAILGGRIIAAAVLLAVLIALDLLLPTVFPMLVAIALIVAPTLCWAAVAWFAARSLSDPTIQSLRDRAQTSLLLAIAATAASILGWILVARALNVVPPIPRDVFLVGLSFALLLIAGPAANWLITWQPWRRDDDLPSDVVARRIGGPES